MKAHIQKWGNSLALRIPKSFAIEARLEQGSLVEVSLVDEKLIVEPVSNVMQMLERLLDGVTEQNLHHEIDTGPPLGKEVW